MKPRIIRKSQELYPIPDTQARHDFVVLSGVDDSDIRFLAEDYRQSLPDTDPAHFLVAEGRSYLTNESGLREPYKAGIVVGAFIGRQRLRAIGISSTELLMTRIPSSPEKLSRYVLSQFFDQDVVDGDLNRWRHHHPDLSSENDGTLDRLRAKLVKVGIGDILALYGELNGGSDVNLHFREIPISSEVFQATQLAREVLDS
jgi:hypothetical protein